MDFVYFFMGLIAGMIAAGCLCWYYMMRQEKKKELREAKKLNITLEDLLHLEALNINVDVNSLMIEHRIPVKETMFYEKYQDLVKRQKEWYFDELLKIFGKNKRNYVNELFERYDNLSTQDVVLLLMGDIHLENKTIARVMQVNLDALKKRKRRLKLKMQAAANAKNEAES